MPTYQYACTACDHRLEMVQSFSDDPLTQCPACEGRLRKVFSSVGVVFKGSGFYRTDSRAEARANGGRAGGKDGGAGSDGKSEGAKSGGSGDGGSGGAGSKDTAAKDTGASKGDGNKSGGGKQAVAAGSASGS